MLSMHPFGRLTVVFPTSCSAPLGFYLQICDLQRVMFPLQFNFT